MDKITTWYLEVVEALVARYQRVQDRGAEHGGVTVEQVVWTVGLLALAGAIVAVVTTFVNTHSEPLKGK